MTSGLFVFSAQMAEHVCGVGSHAVQGVHCDSHSATIMCPGDSTCEDVTSGETSFGVCCSPDQSAAITMAGKEWNTHVCLCEHAYVHTCMRMYR